MLIKELDRVSPLRLYLILRQLEYPFILMSAEKHSKKARFTYLSAAPEFIVSINERGTYLDGKKVSKERNPFKGLKGFIKHSISGERFMGGLVGYIAYDAVHNYIEGNVEEPSVFGYYPWTYIYDHLENKLYFVSLEEPPFDPEAIVEKAKRAKIPREDGGSSILKTDANKEEFVEIVEKGKEYIFSGDVFQVVLSREYVVETDLDPFTIYLRLLDINPSPYTFLLEFEKVVVGASPETMGSVEGKIVKINPIAGTIPRGKNEEEDKALEKALLSDEKERAEHVMLVDLARNDVRRVSKPRSVKVVRYFDVVKYSYVQHIESEIIGELAEDKDMFDAIEATFPAGTLTGAPKIRAMEIIDELEKSRRRVYGGAVGYFSVTGYADFAIAIRMAEIDKHAHIRAGAGIVADSIPEKEFYETENKMRAVLKAFGVE
ncbi:anthranilate synthase component I [Pyrococcus furiosus DSM 3638]|uniref:Anthranilate synthase component 1 n=3 Tax=Pyrococcus furiosus TaxID=2261 RepID=Q8U090_PYRFU|nr:anthranilate synthase component I [Pyrococcus furiosus]AAL81833.1 anthranilate synthase component I [Pyrococcus furiosus DSM 3638]AFN04931.1 anthranilate synthase component I [Pyrococcus furiosus COM1]QEK79326.1 anthranilate synthase component I [Pyrococcus furiosus DSM 3638]